MILKNQKSWWEVEGQSTQSEIRYRVKLSFFETWHFEIKEILFCSLKHPIPAYIEQNTYKSQVRKPFSSAVIAQVC